MARRLGDSFLLTMALGGRSRRGLSLWHDGVDERLGIGAEPLALRGKPVTTEALAHVMLMAASSGCADFATADQHAGQAARIADRYDLPTVAAAVSIYRATRAALDGAQPPLQSSTSRRPRSTAGSGRTGRGPGTFSPPPPPSASTARRGQLWTALGRRCRALPAGGRAVRQGRAGRGGAGDPLPVIPADHAGPDGGDHKRAGR